METEDRIKSTEFLVGAGRGRTDSDMLMQEVRWGNSYRIDDSYGPGWYLDGAEAQEGTV
jgi:hypothetical protein